jgi:hypothetical protein
MNDVLKGHKKDARPQELDYHAGADIVDKMGG